jgi:hypothetical protein
MTASVDPLRCPLCGNPNECQLAAGRKTCWCFFEMRVHADVLARIPFEAQGLACVCRRCATRGGSADEVNRRRNGMRWTRR